MSVYRTIGPLVINWVSQLSILGLLGAFVSFLFHFSMKSMLTNRIDPDGMPCFVASHLGLFCLPMSHKKDSRLIWVNHKYKKKLGQLECLLQSL